MNFDSAKLTWTREPLEYSIAEDKIEIITKPHTDLWQRTYYHFRNDNAPVLQMETSRCVSAICGMAVESFGLAFTHAVRKTRLLRQLLQIWN